MSKVGAYDPPEGLLALDGPTVRPAPGVLPLRGDLAHIALAGRYFVPHFVMPQLRAIGTADVALRLTASDDTETIATLAAGSVFEVLDHAGGWSWGCVGPDGPAGYILTDQLAESGQ